MIDDRTADPKPDPELTALLGEYGSFLNRYMHSERTPDMASRTRRSGWPDQIRPAAKDR